MKDTLRIHAKYMQGLYSACILLVSCSDVWDTPVFYCILLVSCLYRVGYFVSRCHATFMCEDTFVFAPRVLYLDRIRWFPDSRTGIHPEYIRIHQNTSGYCIHRNPTQISCERGRVWLLERDDRGSPSAFVGPDPLCVS